MARSSFTHASLPHPPFSQKSFDSSRYPYVSQLPLSPSQNTRVMVGTVDTRRFNAFPTICVSSLIGCFFVFYEPSLWDFFQVGSRPLSLVGPSTKTCTIPSLANSVFFFFRDLRGTAFVHLEFLEKPSYISQKSF